MLASISVGRATADAIVLTDALAHGEYAVLAERARTLLGLLRDGDYEITGSGGGRSAVAIVIFLQVRGHGSQVLEMSGQPGRVGGSVTILGHDGHGVRTLSEVPVVASDAAILTLRTPMPESVILGSPVLVDGRVIGVVEYVECG